jgi:hypothetical protein
MLNNPNIKVCGYIGFSYTTTFNEITVGFDKKQLQNFETLTDKEKNTFISEALMHEYIHFLLDKTFNTVVNALFDSIGDKFRTKTIARKVYKNSNAVLWSDAIKKEGFNKAILSHYGINHKMLYGVKNICNKREYCND